MAYNIQRASGINNLKDQLKTPSGRKGLWEKARPFVIGAAAGYLAYKIFFDD